MSESLSCYLKKGAINLNEALIKASKSGFIEIIKILIDAGANNLNKALLVALRCGYNEIVKYLIKMGATNLEEAIEWASKHNECNVITLFLQKCIMMTKNS